MPNQRELADGRRFDSFAPTYDDTVIALREAARSRATAALREAGSRRVLDIGCGTGTLLLELAEMIDLGHGLDVSDEMLAIASAKAAGRDNLRFGVGSFDDVADTDRRRELLELADGAIDGVVTTYAMHHLEQEQKCAAIEGMCKLVEPGGVVVIGDLMAFDPSLVGTGSDTAGYDPDWDRPETPDWLAGVMESQGLSTRIERLDALVGVVVGQRLG